jgi:hypothetical protein
MARRGLRRAFSCPNTRIYIDRAPRHCRRHGRKYRSLFGGKYRTPQALDLSRPADSHATGDYRQPGPIPVASIPEYNIRQQQSAIFQQVAAYNWGGAGMNLSGGDHPEQVLGIHVTMGYFALFGAPVVAGRTFTAAEDSPHGGHVAVLSYGLWQIMEGIVGGAAKSKWSRGYRPPSHFLRFEECRQGLDELQFRPNVINRTPSRKITCILHHGQNILTV